MVQVVIKSDFCGPTILELASVINDVQDKVIQLRWENTRAEAHLLRQHKRDFLLYVKDPTAAERTATLLGLPLTVEASTMESARGALNTAVRYNWRDFVKGTGINFSRSLLTKLAADAIRLGKKPKLALIASECLLDGTKPEDADVLLRLRTL